MSEVIKEHELLSNYQKLNNSFRKKTLIYRIGFRYGFFSEYNNMIFAMLYCLENKMRFVLYSKHANFSYEKGWNDYFMPFCEESSDNFHFKHNYRDPLSTTFFERNHFYVYLYKMIHPNHFLTFKLWDKFRNKINESKTYNIPELGINGNFLDACRKLVYLTWDYNPETQKNIHSLISSVRLPENYIGIHIRRGDKAIETEAIPASKYIDNIQKMSNIKHIFVSTDDYNVINEIKEHYKDLILYYLCKKEETGYDQLNFNNLSAQSKKTDMELLFASVDILCNSQAFVGTFNSNVGLYVGMRMPEDKAESVDLEKWQIW